MATGGYRSHNPSSSNTTDFLEEWKAKREKMRAKMYPNEIANSGTVATNENVSKTSNEMNNNSTSNSLSSSNSQAPAPVPKAPTSNRTVEEQPITSVVTLQKKTSLPIQDGVTGGTAQEDSPPLETSSKAKDKGKSCGPSARKGKGQIERRKLREKRRSTGVVNIPSTEGNSLQPKITLRDYFQKTMATSTSLVRLESLRDTKGIAATKSPDDYDDDEAGQKERKKKDTVTQQNTAQNESFTIDPSDWQPESVRNASNRYKSSNNAPDDDSLNRYNRTDWTTHGCHNTLNSGQGISLEKKIDDLEKELAKERQENLRLVKLMQDKEELLMKMKEEIDLLNRDLDDIEDENKQLKQENKTLLKVVGQLTR